MTTSYLILTLLVGPLVGGGVVYFIQSRIRVKEAKDMAGIQGEAAATTAPLAALQQQLAAKDQQLAQARAEVHDFVKSSMERNEASTRAILALAEQVRVQTGNLTTLQNDLGAHRSESSVRAGKTYEAIGKVNERLAGLEAGVKNCLDLATDAAKDAKEAAEMAEKAVKEVKAA